MPLFRYSSRDASGTPQDGVLAAPSLEMLTADLRGRGLLVIDAHLVTESRRPPGLTWDPRTWLPATSFDVEMGLQQLASMLHSGLSLLSALRTVGEQARRPQAARLWQDAADRIEQGSTFTDALVAQGRVISGHVSQLVKVGESTGNLDSALRRAAEHLERSRHLRLTIFNALAYPVIVTVLALGVATFLVVYVIPKLQKYLGGRGRSLPALTQHMLDISAWVQQYLPTIGIILVAALIAIFLIRRWPPGRLSLDRLTLRIPIVGGILRLGGTAVFARGLEVLLESGVTLLDSLRTVEGLLGNHAHRSRVSAAREAVLRGGTLAAPLGEGREFMPMLPRMVAVGENAGTLSHVLDEVARFHEQQIVAVIRRLSVLVEPVIIIVVGVIVGFVYIAFFVALFSLAGGIR